MEIDHILRDFGLILGAGLLSLAWLIGIFALGAGITLILLAFRVRGQGPSGRGGSGRTT